MQSTRPIPLPSEPIPNTILDRTPHSAEEIVGQGVGKKATQKLYLLYHRPSSFSTLSNIHGVAEAARQKLIGTVAQKGGVITVGDVRASFQAREESETRKAQNVCDALKTTYQNHAK